MKKNLLKFLLIIFMLNFIQFSYAKNSNELKKKNLKRAIIENLMLYAYSFPSYWIRHNIMKEDWEFKFTWEDQKRRIFELEGVRFDSNTFQFNWTHSLSGTIYYNFARVNNLNILESFAFSTTISLLWEVFNEFREVVSVNDNIFTPIGGMIIGEGLYNLGIYNYSNHKGLKQKIFTFLTNPVIFLNDVLSRKNKPLKKKNFSPQFSLSFSQLLNTKREYNNPFFRFDFNSSLFNIKHVYDKKHEINQFFKGTLFSNFNINLILSFDKIEEYAFDTKFIFSGKIKKRLYSSKRGHILFYGFSSSYDFFKEMYEINNPDKYAVVNIIGYDFNYLSFKNNLKFYFGLSSYIHFSLINSIGFREYKEDNPIIGTKTTLMQHNYYYAWGPSIYFYSGLKINKISILTKIKYLYFSSIEGLDRFEKYLLNDFHTNDSRLISNIKLGYDNNTFGLYLNFENIHRYSRIKDFIKKEDIFRIYTQIKFYL